MKKPEDCEHEQFEAQTRVGRITDGEGGKVYRYTLDLKVRCVECNMPFEFVGLPAGSSPDEPMTNFDFTELRAPIRPHTGEVAQKLSYKVKSEETPGTKIN